jgi:SAM-dependent methyltransferase
MATEAAYDRIGRGYSIGRRTDPQVASMIWAALGDAGSVLNVGAGTGNYEPTDRPVVGVEPSAEMLRQRRADAAPAIQGVAEALPIRDHAFAATLCVLTLHHWHDLSAGLAELRRVADRQVIFMFDADLAHRLWLIEDYFPEIEQLPTEQRAPSVADVQAHLHVRSVAAVPVPADCIDGFAGSYWNRPEAYLRDEVRNAMSCFPTLGPDIETRGVEALRADLESGQWDERHGHLRSLDEMDLGYRLVVAGI